MKERAMGHREMGCGVISSCATSLGSGFVDAVDAEGTEGRDEVDGGLLPRKVAGLRVGQRVKLEFVGRKLEKVTPDDEDRPDHRPPRP
jgi:hypothetical protein